MKKSVKKSLIIGMFLLGIGFTSSATICATIAIFCPDGSGSYALVCGEDYDEINEEVEITWEVVCE